MGRPRAAPRTGGGSFAAGTLKLSSQPCSLRRAHTDPFPLAVRVIQALVMLLGILVDKFQMNSNKSTDFLGAFKKSRFFYPAGN